MIHATDSSLVNANAAGALAWNGTGTVIPSGTRDLLFPGPSIFRAKQNRRQRNSIGGK
jgi:hypothetical protein